MKNTQLLILITTIATMFVSSCKTKREAFFHLNGNSYSYSQFKGKTVSESETDIPVVATSSKITTAPHQDISVPKMKEKPTTISVELPITQPDKPETEKAPKLTRKEKKAFRKEIKKALKANIHDRTFFMTLLLVILAIILPPLAVLLVDGLRGPFWLDILLTILFYLPGLIYALFRIFRTNEV